MTHTQRQREYGERKRDRQKIELFFNPRSQFGHIDIIQNWLEAQLSLHV